MKTKTFTQIILCCLVVQSSFAQVGKIWVTIKNPSIFKLVQSEVQSNQPVIQTIIHDFNILTVEKAVPSSRKASLQSLYELTCNCTDTELLSELKKLDAFFDKPEIGPKYELLYTPNDYALVTTNDYALNLINAQTAWDITKGDSTIFIGISDSNYDLTHEELVGKYILPSTAVNYNTNIAHGTAVAITAAGKTDNGIGKSSIGFNSRLQLRKMGYNELLNATYSGIKVVNASWNSGCTYSAYVQDIIDEIYDNGTFIVAAAGNGGTCGGASNYVYPASCNHVFSVSSVGPTNNHESTPGNSSTTFQHNDSVDLCAPGYNVMLSIANGNYLTGNGSSFSAPYVSGTIALMLAVNPCLTQAQIEQILKTTAFPLDSLNPNYSGLLGAGRLDAGAAVQMADSLNLKLSATQNYNCGSGEQQISISIIGSSIPFSISWNTNDSSAILSNVLAGIEYTATVTDTNGCIGHISVIPDTLFPIEYEASIKHVSCNGEATGSIELAVQGGKPGYSFIWSNGLDTDTVTNLTAGIYSVTILDQLGCSVYLPFEINQPEKLNTSLFVAPSIIPGNFNIDLTVSGGTFPFEYQWNTGSNLEDLTGITNGIYHITVIDNNQCTVLDSIEIVPSVGGGGTIGLTETNSKEFRIFPNPTSDYTTITWGDLLVDEIECYNISGELITTYTIEKNQQSLTINRFSPGMYTLKIYDENKNSITRKLIVKH